MLCALVTGGEAGAGLASPLDFLFGAPPRAARGVRPRHRPPVRPHLAEVPLPPPRPRFPGDPPPSSEAPPAAAIASPPPERGGEAFGPPKPPLPPGKPGDIAVQRQPAWPPSTIPSPSPSAPPAPGGPPPAATAPEPPPKPPEVAAPGTALKPPAAPAAGKAPSVAPSGATTAFTPRSPADDPQCPSRLASEHIGVEPTTIGPQPDARCTVVEPVHLADVTLADGTKVSFPDRPTIACETADSFASYVRDLLVPLAKGTFGTPVASIWTGPGLECRARDSVFGAKLSAHGQGLAIDIAQLKLADGRLVEVGSPKSAAETAFETAARAGACGYFHTVLGPGSDSYHRTHWHFDLEVRGTHGDTKFCK